MILSHAKSETNQNAARRALDVVANDGGHDANADSLVSDTPRTALLRNAQWS